MTNSFLERISKLPQKKLALLASELYERSLSAGRANEPIAIVAMACRMPGGCDTPAAFWSFLDRGGDAVEPFPDERFTLVGEPPPHDSNRARQAGSFLRDVERFDAGVFGIPAKEAASMDPQQRLLLEVCWEALENAGTPIGELQDSSTGVFVGVSNIDYALLNHAATGISADYAATGMANAIAAGRISYVFGFNGPSSVVDTACSASASAIHLACQSLRARECEQALAGGVNLALLPEITQTLADMQALAPDGRCKAFSATADGFGRGEGCAMLVLRRLSDATARGDVVLGVIRGSAWNQDGRSSGLTAPNGVAQERVVRAALAAADVRPDEISYVEAHGTGTALGDPIEIAALGRVFGAEPRSAGPLRVGSVKTNIGHLEAAAGVAGVMKVVLALQHERIPPHLHASVLNPRVDWPALPIEIPTDGAAWPRGERPRLAGVSSFGFSGTNVHLIVGEAPSPADPERTAQDDGRTTVLTASAKSREALLALAGRYAEALERPGVSFPSFAASANLGRSAFAHRLAFIGSSAREAAAQLRMFASGDPRSQVRASFVVSHRPPRVAFVADADLRADAAADLIERWRGFGVDGEIVDAATPDSTAACLVTLRRDDERVFLDELVELYLGGVAIDWRPLHGDPHAVVVLPNYPFERQRHWADVHRRAVPFHAGDDASGADGIYRIAWNAPPAGGRFVSPPPAAIFVELVANLIPQTSDDYQVLARFQHAAEAFAVHSILTALVELEPSLGPRTRLPAHDLADLLGVVPEQARLLDRIFRLLSAHGLVRLEGGCWIFESEIARYDLRAEIADLRRRFPDAGPEVDLAERTLELPRVLRGLISGVDVLFPDGSLALATAIYRDTLSARLMNALTGQAAGVATSDASRPPRILEIGAGTGGTTASVLPSVPLGSEYVFTDMSTGFFATAKATFGEYHNLRFRQLDIENVEQVAALAAEPFDIIVAANVLHATRSVRDTLANVRSLLRDGGVLILLEATNSPALVDITFGATEGWANRTDTELRPHGPLLSRQRWLDVLAESGFEADALPTLGQFGPITEQQTIVAARRTAEKRLPVAGADSVIVVHYGSLAPELPSALVQQGFVPTSYELGGAGAPDGLAALLAGAGGRAVVFLDDARDDDALLPENAQRSVGDLLEASQMLLGDPERRSLWIVTRNATPAFGAPPRPAAAALWPLGRVLLSEHPELDSHLVDIDRAAPDWTALAAVMARGTGEREIALGRRGALVPRLEPARLVLESDVHIQLSREACYVVTGAFGTLGMLTAKWLASRGAGALILAGRRPPNAQGQRDIEELCAAGTRVEVVVADLSEPGGVDAIFDRVADMGRPLRGIIHSAAALSDAAISKQTRATIGTVFGPKARAAWRLHERSLGHQLDFFVMYSSAASLLGSRGLANYAAANGFLDGLALHRRARGLCALSVDWGIWELGMLASKQERAEGWTKRGVAPIRVADGLLALERAMLSGEPQLAIFGKGAASVLRDLHESTLATIIANARQETAPESAPSRPADALATFSERLRHIGAGSSRREILLDFIRTRCVDLLNLAPGTPIADDRPLIDMGLDSLVGLDLRNDLQSVLSAKLPSTLFFDFPTLGDLSRYLDLVAPVPDAETNHRPAVKAERVSI